MTQFIINNWQEIIGAILGIIYLYYEYKADIKMWFIGILMSFFYIYVFFNAQIYAYAGIYLYYIIAQAHGWYTWNKIPQVESPLSIMPTKKWWNLIMAGVPIFALLLFILHVVVKNELYLALSDSFITTLSILAIWMLAKKYAEQWLLLIVANIASTILFFVQRLYPSSILFFIFAVVSVFGYIRWKRIAKQSALKE